MQQPGEPDQPLALITGAAGFVGRHLVAEIERETNWRTLGLARRATELGSRTRVLACDLTDGPLVERVIERHRPDYVFHLAAQSYVPKSVATPNATISNNVNGQLNLLESLRRIGNNPIVVVIGSAEEYGLAPPEAMPLSEDQPFRPASPYGVSKIAQDMLGLQYFLAHQMRVIRMRPFNHFGPGQSDRFVLSSFSRQVAEIEAGLVEPTVLTGNLQVRRDFLDVRDVVRAYRVAVERARPGEVYNLSSGRGYLLSDLLAQLIGLASTPVEVRTDPARLRPADVPTLVGDSSKFRRETGWEPRFSIEQTLADTLDDWRARIRHEG